MRRLIAAVAAGLLLSTPVLAQDRPRVTLPQGEAIGVATEGVEAFKGLPFAADAGGENRWRSPRPAPAWTAARDAAEFGPICTQRVSVANPALRDRPQSEDCLNLNVWRPTGASKAPVMVWIHGGANVFGSGSDVWYDGVSFARRGVILVTINYRLGHLGFFGHPALEGQAEGNAVNYGLLDQIAALRWVRDNIGAMGGDPANVTVFGESAGGGAVLNLIASPDARGLFAKAIVQSGGGLRLPRDLGSVTREGRDIATKLGLTSATAEALRAVPAARFLKDGIRSLTPGFGAATGAAALPEAPLVAIRGGRGAPVPLIIGSNTNEASLMLSYGMTPDAVLAQFGGRAPALTAAYGPAVTRDDAEYARRLYGDVAFAYPARAIAIAQARVAPVWLYTFDYVPEARRGQVPGTAHAGEIPYVFDTPREKAGLPAGSPADVAYAQGVHGCFTAIAISGTPSAAPLCAEWDAFERSRENSFLFQPEPAEVERRDKRQLDAIGTLLSRLNMD